MRLISQKSWEIGNYRVISVKPWHIPYTYRYIANFLTDDGSLSVVRSSSPSSSLQWLGTSDMSLKEVQVASSLGRLLGERRVYTTTARQVCEIQSVAVCHSLFCRELLASQGGVALVVV